MDFDKCIKYLLQYDEPVLIELYISSIIIGIFLEDDDFINETCVLIKEKKITKLSISKIFSKMISDIMTSGFCGIDLTKYKLNCSIIVCISLLNLIDKGINGQVKDNIQ